MTQQQWKDLLTKLEKIKTEKHPFKEEPPLDLPPERKPVWVKPKYVCEVEFMNFSIYRQMRAPSFERLRDDKTPEECDIEEEIETIK